MNMLRRSSGRFESDAILLMANIYDDYVKIFEKDVINQLPEMEHLHLFTQNDIEDVIEARMDEFILDFDLIFVRDEIKIDREIVDMQIKEALEAYPYLGKSTLIDTFFSTLKEERYIEVSRIAYEVPFNFGYDALFYNAGSGALCCRGLTDDYGLLLEFAYVGPPSDNAAIIKEKMYSILDILEENARALSMLQEKNRSKIQADLKAYLTMLVDKTKEFRRDDYLFL